MSEGAACAGGPVTQGMLSVTSSNVLAVHLSIQHCDMQPQVELPCRSGSPRVSQLEDNSGLLPSSLIAALEAMLTLVD